MLGEDKLFADAEAAREIEELACDIRLPEKFPAHLDDFLKFIVKAKEPDAVKRLRDFFRSQTPESEDKQAYAARRFGELRTTGILDQAAWAELAVEYLAWWEKELSRIRADVRLSLPEKTSESSLIRRRRWQP